MGVLVRESQSQGEIPTNYTRRYAETRGWGFWEILREFFQNALDITGPVGTVFTQDNPTIKQTSEGLVISDRGKGFNALNLLMGTTTKRECERGRFGEGMKIACLAALNLGFEVDITTDSMHISPQWKTLEVQEPSGEIVKAEIMVFKYEKAEPIGGTRVMIRGNTISSWGTMLDRFNLEYNKKIILKRDTDLCEDKQYPSYIIDETVKRIYVRNIYVQDIGFKIKNQLAVKKSLYSYDLFGVRVSTDRNIPNTADITYQIGRLWSRVSDAKMIDAFFSAVDSEGYESDIYLDSSIMHKVKVAAAWKEGFRRHYGNAFLRTGENETRLAEYHTHFRQKGVFLPEGIRHTLERVGISTDITILRQIESVLPRSSASMTAVQLDNVEYIKMIHYIIKDKYFTKQMVGCKVFVGSKDTMEESQGKVRDGNIYIREDMLLNMVDAIDVYSHELTHIAYPELSDNTSDFYSKIGYVAALITKTIATERLKIPQNIVW
jgi:hypothetical protein